MSECEYNKDQKCIGILFYVIIFMTIVLFFESFEFHTRLMKKLDVIEKVISASE